MQEHDSSPLTVCECPQSARGDRLDRELGLLQQQKEKLQLELEVLRLRQMTAMPPATAIHVEGGQSGQGEQNRAASGSSLKKRTIDWPQDFVPGMSVTSDFNTLDLPTFVASYLAMIKLYDPETTKHMLYILELLMLKAMSYSWSSVRSFYYYLARQVKQHRLEWNDIPAIREMAVISFKHSDLRLAKVNSTRSPPPQPSNSTAGAKQPKGCQTWNYHGSCSCDAEASNYVSLHVCRVCKSAEHPMLHCPKRKMLIPLQQ